MACVSANKVGNAYLNSGDFAGAAVVVLTSRW